MSEARSRMSSMPTRKRIPRSSTRFRPRPTIRLAGSWTASSACANATGSAPMRSRMSITAPPSPPMRFWNIAARAPGWSRPRAIGISCISGAISARSTTRSCRRFPGRIVRSCSAATATSWRSGWRRRRARCLRRSMRTQYAPPRARSRRRASRRSRCASSSPISIPPMRNARALILEEFPEAFVTTSSSVVPQFREFERFTTTAMNAFIGPKVRNYVNQLDRALRGAGLEAELRIMRSNGGVATPAMIAEFPVLTLLSGPAAGVLGGAWFVDLSDRKRLITFDIGGTSADIGVITDGRFSEASARDTFIAGYPVIVPMIDIHTIGAGGGSIAYVDSGGTFRVGPRSAGSQPGPAAYGRGGQEPTVTDANVVLGRLDVGNFLGGEMDLDPKAAHRVIGGLATRLGLNDIEAAEGVVTVVNSNMANAIRSRTVQKGIDPRDYALVAFGGAGPLHGAEVAMMLGIPEVVIPPYPGITSAMGLLTTDLRYDTIRTQFQVSNDLDLARLAADFAAMQRELEAQFAADGVDSGQVAFHRHADARYVGQGYELRISMPAGDIEASGLRRAFDEFHRTHEAEYGHFFADAAVELVNIRLTGVAPMPKIGRPPVPTGIRLSDALVKRDKAVFRIDDRLESFETAYYRRDKLPIGVDIAGPAIILQIDSTTVVPPGCTVAADDRGNLILRIGGAR